LSSVTSSHQVDVNVKDSHRQYKRYPNLHEEYPLINQTIIFHFCTPRKSYLETAKWYNIVLSYDIVPKRAFLRTTDTQTTDLPTWRPSYFSVMAHPPRSQDGLLHLVSLDVTQHTCTCSRQPLTIRLEHPDSVQTLRVGADLRAFRQKVPSHFFNVCSCRADTSHASTRTTNTLKAHGCKKKQY